MRASSAVYTSPLQYGKSFANSHEAILLRRVLQDEGSREPFQRYLCIKASPGTHPQEDIQFWLEVQRYKVEPPHSRAYLINFSWSRITWLYIIIGLLHVRFISVSLRIEPDLKVTVTQPSTRGSHLYVACRRSLQPDQDFWSAKRVLDRSLLEHLIAWFWTDQRSNCSHEFLIRWFSQSGALDQLSKRALIAWFNFDPGCKCFYTRHIGDHPPQ